ncbi:MAG TPA: DinB family protein [Anaerolineales bacterium]|nr:DinB family protein [Anaerolineales bacterium]
MNVPWSAIIWQQFGAAIDMLDNALRACPDQLWQDRVWDDPTDAPEYTEFWFIIYHALFWTDLYLSGSRQEDFAPPSPFIRGSLPEKPYTKDELQSYLAYCRQKCQTTFETLTDEMANRRCEFPWGEEVSFAELQLYSMRHVQEHASQLSLHLGRKVSAVPDWVARADHKSV